ncbi:hypothetical protein M426DRAFT_261656 [Hypoxylon sp. CI-4A]|nr:hypothetical protein M426DRAFT_261656 [Hypoxylon sp. CI-4A]
MISRRGQSYLSAIMETDISNHPSRPSQQYTTVGSVWQPQPIPQQPPARRGRTHRSALPDAWGEDFYPNNPQFFSNTYSDNYSYSPLQQNSDRAVSPRPLFVTEQAIRARIAELEEIDAVLAERTASMMSPPPKSKAPRPRADTFVPIGKHGDANNQRGNDDDGSSLAGSTDSASNAFGHTANMTYMSTGTLTNLASYPNPQQKAAQNMLAKAKETPSTLRHHVTDSTQGGYQAPFPGLGQGLRNIRSDPAFADNMSQSDRAGDGDYGLRSQPYGPAKASSGMSMYREPDTYSSVLSKGPGAPAPLTAGPPGQRQYQPSPFNSANVWQKDPEPFKPLGKSHDSERSADAHHRRHPYPTFQQPMWPSPEESRSVKSKTIDRKNNPKIVDTLSYEEAKRFFPNGVPGDFNPLTKPSSYDWAGLRTQELAEEEQRKNTILWQQTPAYRAARKSKLDSDFYGGNYMINTDFSEAVREKTRRDVSRAIGSTLAEPAEPKSKVISHKISIEEANAMPTHEHAKSLISMLYQSMAESIHSDSPKYPDYSKRDDTR